MAKINIMKAPPARTGVIATTGAVTGNADGFLAHVRDAKSELFLAGVGAFYAEDKFYASASDEAKRFKDLVRTVTATDPEWVASFLSWLRTKANIRTASIVGAVEYVAAGGPHGRSVINSVIQRADEPGEVMAYWFTAHGRRVPQPVKRGVRDAVVRLYNEATAAKWDSAKAGVRFADVVELVHPEPISDYQSDLFRYLIEERHGRATFEGKSLPELQARSEALRSDNPRVALLAQVATNRAVTWETASAAGEGKMTAEQWMAMYPHMGYMARLRNLRNLDEAGVPDSFKREVGEYLADPGQVARSRQLPMRFLSAYKAAPSLVWGSYLSDALDASLDNVPVLAGRWLVLVDASGSMGSAFSKNGSMTCYEAATVFAAAFARRNDAQIHTYSNSLSAPFPQRKGESTLATVKRLDAREYWMGGGTATAPSLQRAWDPTRYDRVLLITDEQYNWGGNPGSVLPATTPLYTFNVAGYRAAQDASDINRITVGGLSDAAFTMMASVEAARGGSWPWEKSPMGSIMV
jgi:TROVE domain